MIRVEVRGGPYDGTQIIVHQAAPLNSLVQWAVYGMPLQKEGDLYILEWADVGMMPTPEEMGRVMARFLPLIKPPS